MLEVESHVVSHSLDNKNGEVVDQKPFVIRAHHFINFFNLNTRSPGLFAADVRGAFVTLYRRAKENLNDPREQKFTEYVQDLLGLSLEGADEFEDSSRRTYETFLTLPDDHPAEIVEGLPGLLCSACTIGEHCKKLIADVGGGRTVNMLEKDRRVYEKFIKTLDDLNLPKPTITYEQAHFSDADPQQVRRIKTTIGAVRQVLKQTLPAVWY